MPVMVDGFMQRAYKSSQQLNVMIHISQVDSPSLLCCLALSGRVYVIGIFYDNDTIMSNFWVQLYAAELSDSYCY